MANSSEQQLVEAVTELASRVGFVRSEPSHFAEHWAEIAAGTSADSMLFRSGYALFVFVKLEKRKTSEIKHVVRHAQHWLDLTLGWAAQAGTVLDGYVVIALPPVPPNDAFNVGEQFASDPTVCRKFILGPARTESGDFRWPLEKVSFLALPEPPSAEASGSVDVERSPRQVRLLTSLEASSPGVVAREIMAEGFDG